MKPGRKKGFKTPEATKRKMSKSALKRYAKNPRTAESIEKSRQGIITYWADPVRCAEGRKIVNKGIRERSAKNKIKVPCVVCKKEIIVTPHRKEKENVCNSIKCKKKYKLICNERRRGEKNWNWKSDEELSYIGVHQWLLRKFGKATSCSNLDCEEENPISFDHANISKNYLRDRDDYIDLCRKCHLAWDRGDIEIRLS